MFDEPFARGNSVIHRLDPRFRLAAAILGAVCLAVVRRPESAAWGLALAAGLLTLGRPPLGPLVRRVLTVNVFIAFLWLTVPVTMPGDFLTTWGPLSVSRQGVALATLVTLKSNAILLLFLTLVASMDSPTIGHALEKLRFPPQLVFLFLFTYRYIHVIADEHRRLNTAARLRGFTPRTNMHTYRTVGQILGMVLARSYDRSMRVYEAMTLRGFDGRFRSVAGFRATAQDCLFLAAMGVGLAGLTVLDRFPEVLGV